MIFQPDLAAKVLDGSKTVTRRKPGKYRAGCSYSVQVPITDGPGKGRGGKQLARIGGVLDVSLPEPVGRVDRDEARLEGFDSVADFVAYWRSLYGEWDPMRLVERIEFVLIHPDDYKLWEGSSPAPGSREETGS
jgi:hypothetical protein